MTTLVEPDVFALRLRELIGSSSVADFARKCELGDSLIRKYLDGAMPGLDKALQIARTGGVSLEWLLGAEPTFDEK